MLSTDTDRLIASHQVFADEPALQALFSSLHAEDPLHWTEPPGHPAFWTVTKMADLLEIGKQRDIFLNQGLIFLMDDEDIATQKAENQGRTNALRTILSMNGAEHKLYRGLTQTWFMPNSIKQLDALIQARATEMVDKLEALDGRCDFVNEIAIWYPLRIIMGALGVPDSDHPKMLALTQQMLAPKDPSTARQAAGGVSAKALVVREFVGYFSQVIADRRANPRDDLSSIVANAQVDGQMIGMMEALSYFVVLSTAGHDTTANSLAGGLLALLQHPDEFAKLRAEPERVDAAVEEMFRWVSPVKHFMRQSVRDFELRGKHIREGDFLMLGFHAANRDPEMFPEPYRFRIDRTQNRHVAFGFGAHSCLGQTLARAEMKAFYTEFLKRVESIELDGPVDRVVSNQVSGPKTLPVRYRMKAR